MYVMQIPQTMIMLNTIYSTNMYQHTFDRTWHENNCYMSLVLPWTVASKNLTLHVSNSPTIFLYAAKKIRFNWFGALLSPVNSIKNKQISLFFFLISTILRKSHVVGSHFQCISNRLVDTVYLCVESWT